jgi:Rrf2 family transcriptional regulator, iron-sulfur cluster assembly transcription factor
MSLMLLPQTAEYALRAMACLAAVPSGQGMRAKDLSEASNVPAPYLSKILRRLVVEGLLLSQKGHHGGFALARAPSEITFLQVLHAADFEPDANRCSFGWGMCDAISPCPLHDAYSVLKGEFIEWAARTTLADVDAKSVLARGMR